MIRIIKKVTAGAMIVSAALTSVHASDFPSKPLHIVVPFPPGGGADVATRIVGEELSKTLGQPVVVENKSGADGLIGIGAVARAAPDGYTVGVATTGPVTVAKKLFVSVPYLPETDLVPVIKLYEAPLVLASTSTLAVRNVKELAAYSHDAKSGINFAVPGNGSVQHFLTELTRLSAGVELVGIPYKGGAPAALDVASGNVEAGWIALSIALPFIQSGKIVPLAVAGAIRTKVLPQTPTTQEAGWPQVAAVNWNGIVAPGGTPTLVLEKLNAAFNKALRSPAVAERFAAQGFIPLGGSIQEFADLIGEERVKWGKVIDDAEIKPN